MIEFGERWRDLRKIEKLFPEIRTLLENDKGFGWSLFYVIEKKSFMIMQK